MTARSELLRHASPFNGVVAGLVDWSGRAVPRWLVPALRRSQSESAPPPVTRPECAGCFSASDQARCPQAGRLSGGSEGFAVSGRHSSENPIAARLGLSLKPVGLRTSISMLVRPTYALLRIWLQDRQRLSLRFAGAEHGGVAEQCQLRASFRFQARIYAGSMASGAYADRTGGCRCHGPATRTGWARLDSPGRPHRGLGRVVDEPAHNLGAAVPAAWRQSLDPAPRPARRDRWIGRVAAFF